MDKSEIIKILRNEKLCVKTAEVCDRECEKCPLVMDSGKIIEAYDLAIEMLSNQERQSCGKCIHLGHAYMMPCKNCRRNQMLPDWYEVETERCEE